METNRISNSLIDVGIVLGFITSTILMIGSFSYPQKLQLIMGALVLGATLLSVAFVIFSTPKSSQIPVVAMGILTLPLGIVSIVGANKAVRVWSEREIDSKYGEIEKEFIISTEKLEGAIPLAIGMISIGMILIGFFLPYFSFGYLTRSVFPMLVLLLGVRQLIYVETNKGYSLVKISKDHIHFNKGALGQYGFKTLAFADIADFEVRGFNINFKDRENFHVGQVRGKYLEFHDIRDLTEIIAAKMKASR